MSDTDSFIDEVNEEVRRDQLYGYLRRYGWIGAAVVVLIVGGAAYSEWRSAQNEASAQALGDSILEAVTETDDTLRTQALAAIEGENPSQQAVLDFMAASELAGSGDVDDAIARLQSVATNGDIPEIYRQVAAFKSLLLQSDTQTPEVRRTGLEALAVAGHPFRLLAQEQIALISAEQGDTDAALSQLQSILSDAEASVDLQQRVSQVMVALGGTPELNGSSSANN